MVLPMAGQIYQGRGWDARRVLTNAQTVFSGALFLTPSGSLRIGRRLLSHDPESSHLQPPPERIDSVDHRPQLHLLSSNRETIGTRRTGVTSRNRRTPLHVSLFAPAGSHRLATSSAKRIITRRLFSQRGKIILNQPGGARISRPASNQRKEPDTADRRELASVTITTAPSVAKPGAQMGTYNGRRGPNVSQYLRELNAIPAHDPPAADEAFGMEDDLAMFTNTQFFDFDSGQNTDYNAPPVKPDATETNQHADDLTTNGSVMGDFGIEFMPG